MWISRCKKEFFYTAMSQNSSVIVFLVQLVLFTCKRGSVMWKELSKTDLDAAYNNSLAVPQSAEIVQSWVRGSKDAKNTLIGQCDIPYGIGSFQKFDYFPGKRGSPLVVFLHGGFWQMRSKDDFTFIVPALIRAGLSVAMLGYTLAPYAKMDGIIADVRSGIHAIHAYHHEQESILSGVWLLGWSAGAHLVSMALDEDAVIGGTAISGIYDLEPMRFCYINDKLQLDEAASLKNSPIRLPQSMHKPLDIFVGSAELPEMQRQSSDFADYRKSLGSLGEFENIANKNHYTILDELTMSEGLIIKSMIKRLGGLAV
jgi:arylformamidase